MCSITKVCGTKSLKFGPISPSLIKIYTKELHYWHFLSHEMKWRAQFLVKSLNHADTTKEKCKQEVETSAKEVARARACVMGIINQRIHQLKPDNVVRNSRIGFPKLFLREWSVEFVASINSLSFLISVTTPGMPRWRTRNHRRQENCLVEWNEIVFCM